MYLLPVDMDRSAAYHFMGHCLYLQYMDERAASHTVYLQSVEYLCDIWEPHFNSLTALPHFSNRMATNIVCTCSTVFWVLKLPLVRGYEETAIL
jgi:hypothetical protein